MVNENKENATDSWNHLSQDPVLWLDRLAAIYRVLKPWQCQRAFAEEMEKKGMGDFQPPEAPWLPLTTRVWRIVSSCKHF